MINPEMLSALNRQIANEQFSSQLYYAMMAFADDENLVGITTFFSKKAEEEHDHALGIFDFISSHNERAIFGAIETPQFEWDSIEELFEAALEHEKLVTINFAELYKLAKDLGDNSSEIFIHDYIMEQVEEENEFVQIIVELERLDNSPDGLYFFDKYVGELAAEES